MEKKIFILFFISFLVIIWYITSQIITLNSYSNYLRENYNFFKEHEIYNTSSLGLEINTTLNGINNNPYFTEEQIRKIDYYIAVKPQKEKLFYMLLFFDLAGLLFLVKYNEYQKKKIKA